MRAYADVVKRNPKRKPVAELRDGSGVVIINGAVFREDGYNKGAELLVAGDNMRPSGNDDIFLVDAADCEVVSVEPRGDFYGKVVDQTHAGNFIVAPEVLGGLDAILRGSESSGIGDGDRVRYVPTASDGEVDYVNKGAYALDRASPASVFATNLERSLQEVSGASILMLTEYHMSPAS